MNEHLLLSFKSPIPDHVTIFLNALVDQLEILRVPGDNEIPEECCYLLLEARVFVLDILTQLTEAAKLFHVQLLERSLMDHLEYEI